MREERKWEGERRDRVGEGRGRESGEKEVGVCG